MAQMPGLEKLDRVAEPLVLVPGLMSDARLFSDQIMAFGAERAVHLAPVSDGRTISEMAQRVLETAPPRFALAGQGLGGVVCMEIMRVAPQRVARIALISCSPLSETPQEASVREERIIAAKAGRFDQVVRTEVPEDALAPGSGRAKVYRSLEAMLRGCGGDVFQRQSRALQRRPDQQKTLRRMRAPTLVLCGAYDTITPPRRHEFMAELIPHADLKVLDSAGHLPLLEAPAAVTQALRSWMAAPYRLV